jgi:hypothetical protein
MNATRPSNRNMSEAVFTWETACNVSPRPSPARLHCHGKEAIYAAAQQIS